MIEQHQIALDVLASDTSCTLAGSFERYHGQDMPSPLPPLIPVKMKVCLMSIEKAVSCPQVRLDVETKPE